MSDEDKAALKAELKAKLEAQGVEVPHQWGINKMESVLAEMAIEDDHVPEETVTVPDGEEEGDETAFEELEIPHRGAEKEEPAEAEAEPEPEPEPEAPAEQPEGTLRCRVSKKGQNKIFTGKDDPKYFAWEDIIFLPPENARQLEDRGFLEILDE